MVTQEIRREQGRGLAMTRSPYGHDVARVVVIGAGMGGLAAAARLATIGHDVVVCEQAHRAGGKVGTYDRDGFA